MGWLSSFFGFDDKPAAPTVVQQTSKIPEELAPFVKEILGEAQTLYAAQKERGYNPYTGETIAPLTPEELQAQEGLKGLVGTTTPYLEEALEMYRTGAEKFTPEAAQEYMSPYQRAVTDIEKREAQKVFERDVMPKFEQQAVQAGGMSGLGSRAAIQAGQLGQAQMQQMGDIEAKGLQKAYTDAQKLFAAQKVRETQLAGDIGRTGPAMLQAGLAEQGILQDIGQQKREMAQGALDEAYYKFLKEEAYPQDILASYSGTTYGASPFVGPAGTKTSTGGPQPYQQSSGQQLLGLGMQGLNLYGKGTGGFQSDFSWAKMFGKKEGGGLSDLPVVRRQTGGKQFRSSARPRIVPKRKSVPRYSYRDLSKQHELDLLKGGDYPHPSPDEIDIDIIGGGLVGVDEGMGRGGMTGLAGTTGTKLAQAKDAPANFRTTMRGLAEGMLKDEQAKTPLDQRIKEAIELKSKEPKYDPAVQRKIGEATAAELEAANIASTAERTAIQEGGWAEESKAMTDYLNKNKKFIDEQGGYPGDIIGDAIDQGMEQRGIVRMLSKTLGVTSKGLGKRSKEINKELRKLNKDQFQMEKELRKGKRTDKLANLEKKAARSLNKIAAKAKLSKEIAGLPEKAQQAAMTQLNAVLKANLTEKQMTAKVIGILHDVVKADAATKAAGLKGGKAFTAPEKQVDAFAANQFGAVLSEDGIMLGDVPLDRSSALFKKITKAQSIGRKVYKDTLSKLGTSYQAQVEAQREAEKAIESVVNAGGGTQAGGGTPPANYSNAKKAPDGNWYIPDPKRQGKFLKVN